MYMPQFFEFYATLDYSQFVMSVNAGTIIEKNEYEFPKEISNDYLLTMFGPFDKEYNVGKSVPDRMDQSFVGTASGLFFIEDFLKKHPWNIEYEELVNGKVPKGKNRRNRRRR